MPLLKNYLHSADTDTVPTLGQIGGQAVGIRSRPYGPFPQGGSLPVCKRQTEEQTLAKQTDKLLTGGKGEAAVS